MQVRCAYKALQINGITMIATIITHARLFCEEEMYIRTRRRKHPGQIIEIEVKLVNSGKISQIVSNLSD